MASRSRRLAAALVGLALASGCRWHVSDVAYGGTWAPGDAAPLTVEASSRADVLAALGPPDVVAYTLGDEVLVYRRAAHRGSDLRFLVPDPGLNFGRPGLEELAPELDRPEDFSSEAPTIAVMRGILEFAFGFVNPAGADEAVSVHSRRLRWDVVRVVLDRETRVVRSIEVYRGIPGGEAAQVSEVGGP